MKKDGMIARVVGLILFGILPTYFLFKYHDYICLGGVGMNPWCFILCCIPLIITLPLLVI